MTDGEKCLRVATPHLAAGYCRVLTALYRVGLIHDEDSCKDVIFINHHLHAAGWVFCAHIPTLNLRL